MIELLGYIALLLGLTAMSMKKMLPLRILHASSVAFYFMYGIALEAWPLIIGSCLFLLIHIRQIVKIARSS
ncbi:MAG: YgjV family protein [Cyclobacteriaceae bacterium]|nr:YgjV family protein [Cyclobacteriaceae bacterium HetDA_MAG_MS6]